MDVYLFTAHRVLAHVHKGCLSEFGIVINVHFGIQTVEGVFGVQSPRVDFHLASITFDEHLVEVLHLLDSISLDVAEPQLPHHLLSYLVSHSLLDVDRLDNDILFINILYFHASKLAGNDAGALGVPVLDEGKVYFSADVDAFMH